MSQPPPPPGQPRELNLQKTAEQFMLGLQRHFDMLAFNLSSRACVSEEHYKTTSRAPRVMPVAQAHQNFEQLQAYSRDLLFCQVVNDNLNLCMAALNQMHIFLGAVKIQKAHGNLGPEAQQQLQQLQQTFVQAQLDEKFNRLEEDYGIMCELEDTVTSFGFCLQALTQQAGIVRAAQLDESGELAIELKVAGESTTFNVVGGSSPAELETQRMVFRDGDKITFTDLQVQSLIVTVSIFAHQLFSAVSRYARENHPHP